MVHYFWTVLRVAEHERADLLEPSFMVDVVIPTGAMGNITAATFARATGLPLGRMCAGTNANDVTHRTISNGDFSIQVFFLEHFGGSYFMLNFGVTLPLVFLNKEKYASNFVGCDQYHLPVQHGTYSLLSY
jgi:hypothetical protein